MNPLLRFPSWSAQGFRWYLRRAASAALAGVLTLATIMVVLSAPAAAQDGAVRPKLERASVEQRALPAQAVQAAPKHSKYYRAPGIVDIKVTPLPKDILRELDVKVPMRDGVKLSVNVYRPASPGVYPVILTATRYSKNSFGPGHYEGWAKSSGFEIGRMSISDATPFEAPDPGFWVPRGYVVVHADVRGAYDSEGNIGPITPQDAQDYAELIEWAGTQWWSSGKVGLSGVSYLAFSQWPAAALRPPHLAAMIPWEGVSDHYRDNAFHGGIPETNFRLNAYTHGLEETRHPGFGLTENYALMLQQHPLFDSYWWQKAANLELIDVPALVCATWSAQGNHSRGSFEGFKRISSKNKWMVAHGRVEWPTYYDPSSTALQQLFFDHFLKGIDNGMETVPRVQYDVRKTRDEYEVRTASAWPIPGTKYTKLYLDASDHSLRLEPVKAAAQTSYRADPPKANESPDHTDFSYTFPRDTMLVGNMALRLWVTAEQADDLDLFVGIRKLDADGEEVHFVGFGGNPNDIVTRGWLRVSAREKDMERSTAWQPYLTHTRVQKVAPGQIVPVDIEILPSGTLFEKGATLRLTIQGSDVVPNPVLRHDASVNKGQHTLHTGGEYDANLLIPVVAR
jgi:predicted acyl esterase